MNSSQDTQFATGFSFFLLLMDAHRLPLPSSCQRYFPSNTCYHPNSYIKLYEHNRTRMRLQFLLLLVASLSLSRHYPRVDAFLIVGPRPATTISIRPQQHPLPSHSQIQSSLYAAEDSEEDASSSASLLSSSSSSRRRVLRSSLLWAAATTVAASSSSSTLSFTTRPPLAFAAANTKVLVLGGTGFVGSRVVALLKQQAGVSVTATSTDGRDGTVALNVLQASDTLATAIQKLAAGCTAVISCVGAIGNTDVDVDEKINGATAAAAVGAKAAGVSRFVYITVAPEVAALARDVDFLQGYLRGKQQSRAAVLENFPSTAATLIEPTFIYGGGSFELNPPRVATFYGQFIENLLSAQPVRTLENILSPGMIKLALEPPVFVEDVAAAAVAGALGRLTTTKVSDAGAGAMVLDSHDKIKQAAAAVLEPQSS